MTRSAVIFNIQRFSLHDGPGIRSTVFLKGCPLRCVWCHNPESMKAGPEPMLQKDRCVVCGACEPVCAENLAGPLRGDAPHGHPGEGCTACGGCAAECPTEARRLVGEAFSVEGLLEELRRDEAYHAASHGGVTFSGGEPLTAAHAPFVLACLRRLRDEGRHTALDTCGYVRLETLLEAAALADLVLFDLKIMDLERHREATGVDNGLIHRNLERLLATDTEVQVRVPLIPGYTDDEENLAAVARFLGRCARVPKVSLLPYHPTGRDKYPRLGRAYELAETPAMTTGALEGFASKMRAHGLEVEF